MTLEFRQLRVLGALSDEGWVSSDDVRIRTIGIPRVFAALLEMKISGLVEFGVEEVSETHIGANYRITQAGREALALHSASAKPDEMNPSEVSS